MKTMKIAKWLKSGIKIWIEDKTYWLYGPPFVLLYIQYQFYLHLQILGSFNLIWQEH